MPGSYRYLEQFKKDYFKYGKFEFNKQVPHLVGLADHYMRKYHNTSDWTDCLKAHTLYNSVAVRQPGNDSWQAKAFKIQQAYWRDDSVITYDHQVQITCDLKQSLEIIREKCRQERLVAEELVQMYEQHTVESGLDDEFYVCIKGLSLTCSERMLDFAGQIMQRSIDALTEKPPCDFQAVAIGSLAKGEATPYSDLEYIFVIRDATPVTVAYFEKLAVTSYFLMGNLGETKLSYMAIEELQGWFDDQTKNGFKIDGLAEGAGNIPTGNGKPSARNRFIVTPAQLAKQYQATFNNPQEEALRGDLTAMLTFTKSFYSKLENGPDLLEDFKTRVNLLVPNQSRRDMNLKMLQTDVEKFNFTPGRDFIDKGLTANVKKELYRFPSILLMDLSINLQATAETSWDTLELLINQKSLSKDVGDTLRLSLSAAVYIRLSAYLYHDSHDDRVSVAPQDQDHTTPSSKEYRRWFVPSGLFLNLWMKLAPMKSNLCVCGPDLTPDFLASISFCKGVFWPKITALANMGRYNEAFDSLQQVYGTALWEDPISLVETIWEHSDRADDILTYASFVSDILIRCNEYQAALRLYVHQYDQGDKACKCRISRCLTMLGEFDKALEWLTTDDTDVDDRYLHQTQISLLAEIYAFKGDRVKAENYLVMALQKEQSLQFEELTDYYGNPEPVKASFTYDTDLTNFTLEERLSIIKISTPFTIRTVDNLGKLYNLQRRYRLALAYFLKSLALSNDLYGDEAAVSKVAILINLGGTYRNLNEDEKALDYHQRATDMCDKFLWNDGDTTPAQAQCELGKTFLHTREYQKAEYYFILSLHTLSEIPTRYQTKATSMMIASMHNHLGSFYTETKDFNIAEVHYLKTVAIIETTYPHDCGISTHVVEAYNSLGNIHLKSSNLKKAAHFFFHALSRAHQWKARFDRLSFSAKSLIYLGTCFGPKLPAGAKKGCYYKAMSYLYQALALYKELKVDEPTKETAELHFAIGSLYAYGGHNAKAEETLRKAREFYMLVDPEHAYVEYIRKELLFIPGPYKG